MTQLPTLWRTRTRYFGLHEVAATQWWEALQHAQSPKPVAWLRHVVEQCQAAGVPVFVKQDVAFKDGQQGRIPDEVWRIQEFPLPC